MNEIGDTRMSKESGISLKEYFDDKFEFLKKYMDVRFNAVDASTKLAADTLEIRLESMNEFRESMKDQAGSFITRAEHCAMMQKYDSEIASLMKAEAKSEGMATQKSVIIAYVIATIGIILSGIGLIVHSMMTG